MSLAGRLAAHLGTTSPLALTLDGKTVRLALPSAWRILGEHKPRAVAALSDVDAGLREALCHPIGCEPFAPGSLVGKRIALAVDDVSRPTPVARFFRVVVDHLLAAGARREDLRVVFALGVHRPMTDGEAAAKLGAGALDGIAWHNHDAHDPARLVDLGTTTRGTPVSLNRHLTEADLIVCLGAIEPHLLLGFGGGLKMLVPGLAGQETIAHNHMVGVTPRHFNFVGEVESPMRLDLEEAARKVGRPIFVVNAVMNEELGLCRFACGDPIAAHRQGALWVREIARSEVREPADVVIVASNPMNADLRQGMKGVGHVQASVKEGGLVLALLGCRHGIGDVRVPERTLPNGVLRVALQVMGRERVLPFVDRVQSDAKIEERFLAHFSLQSARRNRIWVYSPGLPEDAGRRLGVFRQFGTVDAMMAAAARAAPLRATVHVWPHGGMTYAALA